MEPQIPNPFQNEIPQQQTSFADDPTSFSSSDQRNWGVPAAFGNWLASILLSLLVPILLVLIYALVVNRQLFQDVMKQRETATLLVLTLIGTFFGQILSLLLSAIIVTELWKKPFLPTLGWQWSPRFKFPHAVGLAILMLIVGVALEYLLPHKETSLEKFLKFGLPVRLALALVATIGAPLVEEVVYRGLLFDALERAKNTHVAVIVVTLLFWGVHIAQYIESIATLAAVLVLSFALTYLRASTKQILPCVVVHTIFNGIQGILIVFAPQDAEHVNPVAQPALSIGFEFCKLVGNW